MKKTGAMYNPPSGILGATMGAQWPKRCVGVHLGRKKDSEAPAERDRRDVLHRTPLSEICTAPPKIEMFT